MTHAGSQTCVSGAAKFSRRSHVVRNLRVYFILYAIKIKWIACSQKQLNFLVCHRDQVSGIRGQRSGCSSIKVSGDLSFATRKSSIMDCRSIFPGVAKAGALLYRGDIYHPMPPWLQICYLCSLVSYRQCMYPISDISTYLASVVRPFLR